MIRFCARGMNDSLIFPSAAESRVSNLMRSVLMEPVTADAFDTPSQKLATLASGTMAAAISDPRCGVPMNMMARVDLRISAYCSSS